MRDILLAIATAILVGMVLVWARRQIIIMRRRRRMDEIADFNSRYWG